MTTKDKPFHGAYIAGASFPDGHTSRLNSRPSTLCIQLLHNHPFTACDKYEKEASRLAHLKRGAEGVHSSRWTKPAGD